MIYYCTKEYTPGITCTNRSPGGLCEGGRFCSCPYKSKHPPAITLPMPICKPPKKESTDCKWCEHMTTCKYKNKFNRLKDENYPVICECVHFKKRNPLQEV